MISFREAVARLVEEVPLLETEPVRIDAAAGRILRREITADREFPPFDRVMMDGYALRQVDWENGIRCYAVTGQAPAGAPRAVMSGAAGSCVEVMTGAPCPEGADCIVPVEEVAGVAPHGVNFREEASPVAGRFIHRRGSDVAAGEIVLPAGIVLGARELGVAASCGAGWLEVTKPPRISVVATGDELVAVDETPEPHQIRQSNAWALAAGLSRAGYPAANIGTVCDDEEMAIAAIAEWLAGSDWLILSGAVSKGVRDFVPVVLKELGCECLFHGVEQRPGKPAGCWIGPAGQRIVALPGNPVSAITGLHTLVIPALAKASGLTDRPLRRVILEDRSAALEKFTLHLPVVIREDGRAAAAPTGNSGDFIGLLKSDGFVTLPPRTGQQGIAAAVPFTPWL